MEAELSVDLGILLGENEKTRSLIEKMRTPRPLRRPFGASIYTGASPANPILVEVGNMSPAKGRFWEVVRFCVLGPDGHTALQSSVGVNQIQLGASGVASYNNNSFAVQQTISGGTVTAIAINGVTTGLTSGTFTVPAGGSVTVTYSVAPTTFSTTASAQVIADLYGGPTSGVDNPGDLMSLLGSGTIPYIDTIGDKKNFLYAGDVIYAWVYNAPANTNISIAGVVFDWRIEDDTEVSI